MSRDLCVRVFAIVRTVMCYANLQDQFFNPAAMRTLKILYRNPDGAC